MKRNGNENSATTYKEWNREHFMFRMKESEIESEKERCAATEQKSGSCLLSEASAGE